MFRAVVFFQASYYAITAIWPLIDIDSFMWVTGPKTDIWLVKTVGLLLVPVATTLFYVGRKHENISIAALLGILTALAFAWVDFYYSLTGVISPIYMADGGIQVLIIFAWLIAMRRN